MAISLSRLNFEKIKEQIATVSRNKAQLLSLVYNRHAASDFYVLDNIRDHLVFGSEQKIDFRYCDRRRISTSSLCD